MKKSILWRGIAAALALILTVGLFMSYVAFDNAGSINAVLGIESGSVSLNGTMVYESSYGPLSDENLAKLVADEAAFAVREMEEGAVLFKNDGALPLASGIKNITLGQGAIQTVSKPANKNADGPDGYGMAYRYGEQDSPTCYVIQNLAVSTWSTDVMSTLGSFYGEDCIYARG